jgi:hypothetical protein
VGYRFNQHWALAAEVFNLFDARVSDIDYFYASRLPGEPENPANPIAAGGDGGYGDVHFHPAESRTFRVILTARY